MSRSNSGPSSHLDSHQNQNTCTIHAAPILKTLILDNNHVKLKTKLKIYK